MMDRGVASTLCHPLILLRAAAVQPRNPAASWICEPGACFRRSLPGKMSCPIATGTRWSKIVKQSVSRARGDRCVATKTASSTAKAAEHDRPRNSAAEPGMLAYVPVAGWHSKLLVVRVHILPASPRLVLGGRSVGPNSSGLPTSGWSLRVHRNRIRVVLGAYPVGTR